MTRIRGRHHLGYLLVAIAFFYFLFVSVMGWGIPCLFHVLTGYDCPGCGVTRMILSLSQGDFLSSYQANPFLFLTWPFLAFEIYYAGYHLPKLKKKDRVNDILLLLYGIALLAFGVLRNIFPI